MNRLLKLILVFLLTLFTTLAASEKETKDIAKISAASLYNIDKSSLEKTINAYVQSNQKLVGLKIVETLSGETYYKMYKKDGNIFFDKEFPNDINKNFKFTAESKYDNEPVGKVIAYFKETNKLNLTSEEIKWIKNNPFIKIATMKEWKPFDIPTTNGKQIGFHNDLINLLNKKSSMNLVLKPYESWKEAYEDVTTGEVYAITSLSYTKEREEKYFNYTDPYHFTPYQVIVKKSSNISSLRDLADKKIAIREKSIAKIIAEESIENPILNFYPRIEEVYKSIQSGVTEATLIANIEQETLSKYDLKVIDEVMHKASEIHIGVNKDYKTLSKIINKAVKAITLEEMSELRQKWFVEYMNASFEKYKSKINISLTNEEKKWLKAHKNIKFTADPMYLPYESFNEDGKYIGMVADYLKIIEETLEISFEKIPTISWTESLEKAYNAEVDILSNYTNDGSLKDIHISTKPYIESPIAVFTKNDLPKLNNLTNLKNKKVAVVKGYGYLKQIFKDYPDLNYIEVDNARVGMLGVSSGKYDAMICSLTLGVFKIGEHGLHNLQIALQTDYTMELGLGIRKDWKPLVGIINKVIDSISRGTSQEITKKWLGQKLDSINKVKLTQKEQAWIDKKTPVKYVYDPDWAPFEWTSELGSHTGILFELINIISERSGIIFEPITTNTWSEAVKMAENAEVDMYSGVGINEKRQSYMNFTKGTIYETPYVFVTHKTNEKDLFETFKSLSGDEKIGVLDNTIAHSILKEKHPDIFLTAVTSTMDGFKKLNEKKIDIFFINAATAKYYINNRGFTNLKIATKTKYTLELKVALQKTMPSEVISIIDKAIKTITERELTDIYRKWTEIQIEQEVDWNLVYKIAGSALIVLLLILYWNRKLKQTVEQKTSEITKLLHSFDENVIALKADLSGNITYVSHALCKMSGYSSDELLGKSHAILKDPSTSKEFLENLLLTVKKKKIWKGESRNKNKAGEYYWVYGIVTPEYDTNKQLIGYSDIKHDITAQKEFEKLSETLEHKVEERTEAINTQKQYINAIMNSQRNIVISTDGEKIRTANHSFFEFFNIESIEEFLEIFGDCICDTFDTDAPKEYLQKMMGEEKWIEYVYNRPDQIHKARITRDGKQNIFTITSDKFTVGDESLETAVFTNITELEKIREEVEAMHKHTQSSIEYASLIQHSLIPENDLFRKYFDDYLTIWHPKDIVGGDIYLFDELRDDNECLLIVIDCTGHGVPGAFVTMLVKAIERQIAAIIGNNPDQKVSPAWILQYFNHTMKHLLKQETEDAISNAGFDGGILYYNKKEKLIKFAGAEIPLFYTEPDSNEYKMIKGDRHSIGYKKSDADYKFTDHIIEAKEGMQFYLTTDGYIDQNGGEKGFPFGKKRFKALIEEYAQEPFADQQEVLLDALAEYQKDEERNDDITVVGVKLGKADSTPNTTNMMWSI